jgi:hypothetical protein
LKTTNLHERTDAIEDIASIVLGLNLTGKSMQPRNLLSP